MTDYLGKLKRLFSLLGDMPPEPGRPAPSPSEDGEKAVESAESAAPDGVEAAFSRAIADIMAAETAVPATSAGPEEARRAPRAERPESWMGTPVYGGTYGGAQARAEAGAGADSAVDLRGISDFFERDARRYPGGFQLL